VRYDAVAFHARTPAGVVDYDSARAAAQPPPMAAGLAALVRQQYALKLSPEGQVIQLTGMEKILAAVLARMNVPDLQTRAAAEKLLRQQLSGEAMKVELQDVFAPFADHPVSTKESWARQTHLTVGFPLEIESTYTLKERDKGIATIDLAGKASTPGDATIELGPNARMHYNLSGEQHGTMQVEEASGWTRSAQCAQKLSGSALIQMPGAPPQPVPLTIESNTTVETRD